MRRLLDPWRPGPRPGQADLLRARAAPGRAPAALTAWRWDGFWHRPEWCRTVQSGVAWHMGRAAKDSERERFLEIARRFKQSSDPDESERLREKLAQLIFGE